MFRTPSPDDPLLSNSLLISSPVRKSLLAAGGILVFLAGVVLVSWWAGELTFVQLHSGCSPLHYNSALGLLIWGLGFVAFATNRRRITAWAGCSIALWGLLFCIARAAGFSGIFDSWLFAMRPQ